MEVNEKVLLILYFAGSLALNSINLINSDTVALLTCKAQITKKFSIHKVIGGSRW